MTRAVADLPAWLDGVPTGPSALTIGQFDGVHRGHQRLLAETRRWADSLGVTAGAVTFAHHPLHLLAPDRAPAMLTRIGDKIELLRAHGMDFVLTLPLTADVLGTPAEQFADELIAGRLGAQAVVLGADFRYGAGAAGDPNTLAAQLNPRGAHVRVVNTVMVDGERVSSTRIRRKLASGHIDHAARLLARRHRVRVTATDGGTLVAASNTAWPHQGRYRVTVSAADGASAVAPVVVSAGTARIIGLSVRPGDRLTLIF